MRTAVAKDKAKDKNVVHARLKRMGLRFELSLNRDKVPSKKDIAAKDFDPNWNEILFAQLIFSNAAKNEVAEKADVQKAFPDTKETDIFRLILEKGEILASLEERNESNADDKTLIARLAAHVASTSHVRPSSDELADTKKKHRLARYTAADIERELKNIKYKTGNASFPDQALDVISAIHTCGTLSIVRDMRVVVLEVEKPQMEESKRAIASLFRPCDHRVLNATADTITVLFDYAIEVAKVARSVEVLVPATIRNSEEFYIPKGDADDLTSLSPLSGKTEDAPAAKTGKKDAKPAAKTATASKGDAPASGAASGLSALEAELKALQADDSDDDNRKGKGGKGKGKGGKAPPAPKPAAKATAKPQGNNGRKGRSEFSDSDEEES